MAAMTVATTVAMTESHKTPRRYWRWILLGLLMVVQALCTVFFVADIVMSAFGLRSTPLPWEIHEALEMGALLGLFLGLGFGAMAFRRLMVEARRSRASLARAQSAFMELLETRFADWALSPAERDVALFSIKGLSTAEIAELRGTSEGTIKAQSNAIYRKAGVNGRSQLLGLFIEDMAGAA